MEAPADRYQVLSMVPDVTELQLAEATTDYPQTLAWVYLSLPEDLPQRIVTLAEKVTANADGPYERALALEAYLRTIPYDLRIPKAPRGRDVVEYFLFELQRGYCDYFASAMAVMARAVGIPSRLAVGYAMGQYDAVEEAYVVTALDALLSLGEQGQLPVLKLTWYERIGTADPVQHYWVEQIGDSAAYGGCGFVYETGPQEFAGFRGTHIHIPSDLRVTVSPEYALWFWICL